MNTNVETFKYDNRIVRAFAIATAIWAMVGISAGLLVACQLFWPALNLNLHFTTFGRLRPLHTNAVIFAFVGNGMFMGIYYSLQRLCKARMFSDALELVQLLGLERHHRRRRHHAAARPHHQQGIRGTGMADRHRHRAWSGWRSAINLFGTIIKRREKHMYVAIWFYIATAITVAVLHIFNSLEMPASLFKSYRSTPACRMRWCNGGMATTPWRSS